LASDHLQEDGDPVDVELVDEGLSSSLRKLILHPLAQDVLDEELQPRLKNIRAAAAPEEHPGPDPLGAQADPPRTGHVPDGAVPDGLV